MLIVLDWVRIQRLELDLSVPPGLYDFFTALKLPSYEEPTEAGQSAFRLDGSSQWILFLLVSVLMHQLRCGEELTSESFRKLYRFITLGMEGM
jgi:hypothetical protein